jgi:hypothetical protein
MEQLKQHHPNERPYATMLDWAGTKKYRLNTQIPAVRVACLDHPLLPPSLEDSMSRMSFPKLNQFQSYQHGGRPSVEIDVADVVRNRLSDRNLLETNTSSIVLSDDAPSPIVVPLDLNAGDAASIGLLILEKRLDENGDTAQLAVVTCTADARWAEGYTVIESTLSTSTAQLGQPLGYDFYHGRSRNVINTELEPDKIDIGLDEFTPQSSDLWRPIRIDTSWYDLLSPNVADSVLLAGAASGSETVLRSLAERLVKLSPIPADDGVLPPFHLASQLTSLEVILTMFLADGISRNSLQHNVDTWRLFPAWEYDRWAEASDAVAFRMVRIGHPVELFRIPEAVSGRNATRMMVQAEFFGYVMAIGNWFDGLSVGVLLLHVVVASAHVVWRLMDARTTEGWDSVPQLVALAQQSAPADSPVLDNSSGGIRTLSTMKSIVMLEAHPKNSPQTHLVPVGGKEELQLRVRNQWQHRDPVTTPIVKETYGAR